ncbi:uncharacterized protein LOC131954058 [Physella acuta]|uniref:uncharacterized protein LOC131954058 n=1 Tax=Physella acuta TaxID=109671 RepID=UPI0027DD760B|nr:uncharacterized protein LOC131954058 [Physella acuta]
MVQTTTIMAAISKDTLIGRIRLYPSIFHHKPAGTDTKRLRDIQLKVNDELEYDDDCLDELVSKYLFLTWVEFELGNFDKSEELSNRALELTKGNSLTALVHSAYVMMRNGDEIQAEECLDNMHGVKTQDKSGLVVTTAQAELAYSLSRLGGPNNLVRAIEIYTEVTDKFPDQMSWKYRLGLAHRRATVPSLFYILPTRFTIEEHASKARCLLFEVAQSSFARDLRAHAYAQLAQISHYDEKKLPRAEHQRSYSNMSCEDLIQMALKFGSNDARTLLECGKILRYRDLDRAIDLLEKSIAIKKHGFAYHQLGLCYVYKANRKQQAEVSKLKTGKYSGRRLDLNTEGSRRNSIENPQCNPDNSHRTHQNNYNRMDPDKYLSTKSGNYNRTNSGGYRTTNNFHSTNPVNPHRTNPVDPYRTIQFNPHRAIQFNHHITNPVNPHRTNPVNPHRTNPVNPHRTNPDSLTSLTYRTGVRPPHEDAKPARRHDAQYKPRFQKDCKKHSFIKSPLKQAKLGLDCEFVKKAMSCYSESIKFSFEHNTLAIYDLGLLLKSCEQLDDAEKQFNKVTHRLDSMSLNFSNNEDEITSSHGHFILVISAYEQAGLCLLEKAQQEKCSESQSEKRIKYLKERGESKLVQAVSLSAMLVKLNTEMKEHSSHIWNALRTLETNYENEEKSPQSIKKFIELLRKTNHHKKVLNIIEKLKSYSDDELDDPVVVSAALESYLALKDYESALAFLNMVTMRPNVDIREVGQLVTSVQTCAIAKRLQNNESGAQLIMKTVFHQHTSGGGCGSGDSCGASKDEVTNKSEVIPRDLDVIVIYDDSHDVEREESDITRTANQLCRVLEKTFGLAVSCNLKDCCSGGKKIDLQFEEMLRAKVALILLGAEKPRHSSFQIFLDNIHYELSELAERGGDVPTVLLVFAAQGSDLGVPSLSCCRQFRLDDILADINNYLQEKEKNSGQEEKDEVPILEDNSSEFSKGVNAVMTLFCSLVDQKWPIRPASVLTVV